MGKELLALEFLQKVKGQTYEKENSLYFSTHSLSMNSFQEVNLIIWMATKSDYWSYRSIDILVHVDLCTQSAENRRKERHRFWLRLRHLVILISNARTSA